MTEELLGAGDKEGLIPLQSEKVSDWSVMILYSEPALPDGASLWSRQTLIAIREFEKEVGGMSGYRQSCLADKTSVEGSVVCSKSGILSPLDLLANPGQLETATDAEIEQRLLAAVNNQKLWKVYSSLFDVGVSATNTNVRQMRTMVTGAGPIRDGETRFKNLMD